LFQRLQTVAGFTYHHEIRFLFKESLDTPPHDRVVID
jgi:hypothetical protein